MKPSHRKIIKALRQGALLWRYSTQNTAYLCMDSLIRAVKKKTVTEMCEAKLIAEDVEKSVYRSGGSDLVYSLVEREQDIVILELTAIEGLAVSRCLKRHCNSDDDVLKSVIGKLNECNSLMARKLNI